MTTIDSQHLRVFCAVARLLNMSRAAHELGVTPSAISHGLKVLEADLGCRLVQRSSRKLVLTPAGLQFQQEAEAILDRMSGARARLRQWLDGRRDTLRIVASTTACQYILPSALREFRSAFPGITIHIQPCTARQGIEALAEEEAHLAFFVETPWATGTEFLPLAEDELHYLVHPLHPWTKRSAERDLAGENLILPAAGSGTLGLIEAYFAHEGTRPRPHVQIGSDEAIKQMVLLDLGVGLLPRWIAAAEIRQGLLVSLSLGRRRLRRRWGAMHRSDRKLGFAESVFVNLCRKVATDLMGDVPTRAEPAMGAASVGEN